MHKINVGSPSPSCVAHRFATQGAPTDVNYECLFRAPRAINVIAVWFIPDADLLVDAVDYSLLGISSAHDDGTPADLLAGILTDAQALTALVPCQMAMYVANPYPLAAGWTLGRSIYTIGGAGRAFPAGCIQIDWR